MQRVSEYQRAEQLLYSYTLNRSRLDELITEWNILQQKGDVKIQRYNYYATPRKKTSDPIAEYVSRLMVVERQIERLKAEVYVVQKVERDLTWRKEHGDKRAEDILNVMHYKYFARMTNTALAGYLHKARRTIYQRRVELVKLMMDCEKGLLKLK